MTVKMSYPDFCRKMADDYQRLLEAACQRVVDKLGVVEGKRRLRLFQVNSPVSPVVLETRLVLDVPPEGVGGELLAVVFTTIEDGTYRVTHTLDWSPRAHEMGLARRSS